MAPQERATGHEPLNTLKPVAKDIWLIDGPPVTICKIPYPSRATVVRLACGSLWIHAPTVLTETLRRELQALGPVGYLVAPNGRHFSQLPDWQQAYPDALLWHAGGLTDHPPNAGAHGVASSQKAAAWADEIDQIAIKGRKHHCETVYFHRASASLICTDLIHNVQTAHLPAAARPLVWLSGADDSDGKMPFPVSMRYRKSDLADAVEAMIALDPQRLLLAHRRWFPDGAVGELRRAFRRILRDREWTAAMEKISTKTGTPD
ncbi:DUF4336 domain-containing protein [Roseovarius dicentrarchi]|uniref:DUF4336 domain-containing protein n=1 Tax=Roseovarius dicentrarchi TaxID=2250573 RepID=UPI0013967275|nr:DUF4336 domain-containing protein [Roseovarius dicentrarchi]